VDTQGDAIHVRWTCRTNGGGTVGIEGRNLRIGQNEADIYCAGNIVYREKGREENRERERESRVVAW